MQAILLCDTSHPDIVGPVCKRYGLGVEMQSFSNPDYDTNNPQGVAEQKEIYIGVQPISLHGPFGDLSMGSCDQLIRQVTRERFDYAYRHATAFGAEHLVLHHGYVPRTNTYGGWLKRSQAFWDEFFADKDGGSLQIHLENLLEQDPQLMKDVIGAINRADVDICLDVGHAHCNSRTPVLKWIEELSDAIGYVHLHDNYGDRDDHLSLGEGNLPLDEVCNALEQYAPQAVWALEVGPESIEGSVFWLESHGYSFRRY